MLQAIQHNVIQFFTKGHARSVKTKINIAGSVLFKAGGTLITFALVPLTLSYINTAQYGIWLTLSSVITWAGLFDMGLGNGLKNKMAAAIALNNTQQVKTYVSSTYAILLAIAVLMLGLFLIINPYINWNAVLNVHNGNAVNLGTIALIIFGCFCIQFVVQLINNVLAANQQPARSALLNLVTQGLTLAGILLLIKFSAPSLTALVIVMAGIPLLVMAGASIILYRGNYAFAAPSFSRVNVAQAKQLLKSGSAFFVIQIVALVLYETDNIVITQLFGPGQVTTFNIAYKLFSVILMFFMVVVTPLWSAFTEAYVQNDYGWIKNALAKIHKLWLGLSACSIVLLMVSPWVYSAWVGQAVTVPAVLSAAMCLYVIAFVWQGMYLQLLNGTGKIKLQLYLGIAGAVVNIPLSVLLGRLLGPAGVTLANVVIFIVMGIFFSIQTKKLVNQTATGIFNA